MASLTDVCTTTALASSRKVVDDSQKTNAENAASSGLEVRVTRTYDNVGLSNKRICMWCVSRCGVNMTLEEARYKGAFQRHEGCGCEIEYSTQKGTWKSQGKDWEEIENRDRIENRKAFDLIENSFDNTKPATFARKIKAAKEAVDARKSWRVDAHSPDDYVGCKLHITPGGSCAAVKPNGDIISVCAREDDTVRGWQLLKDAVKNGGIKLDSYSGNHDFYIRQGFEPVSWCKFDEQWAPPGWTSGLDEPEDIIFYKYTGNPTTVSLEEFKATHPMSKDYDTAEKERDNSL